MVAGPRGRFLGNAFAGGWSIGKGRPDRLNNVENVFLARPSGQYRVTVRAHNLPGDAIPGNARRVEQDFALVISNARVVGLAGAAGVRRTALSGSSQGAL